MSRKERLKGPSGKFRNWNLEFEKQQDQEIQVGSVVRKISRRPFKSKSYTATVRLKLVSPVNNRIILEFIEDDSYVEMYRCEIVE